MNTRFVIRTSFVLLTFFLASCGPQTVQQSARLEVPGTVAGTPDSRMTAQGPVYHEGEYWVYKLEVEKCLGTGCIKSGNYRVEIKDGKVVGDMRFLENRIPTIHISEISDSGWYKFPMRVGMKWDGRRVSNNRRRYYEVKVLRASRVKIKPGTFDALELSRDRTDGGLPTAYAYSPKAKSAVSAVTERIYDDGSKGIRLKLELVEYRVR